MVALQQLDHVATRPTSNVNYLLLSVEIVIDQSERRGKFNSTHRKIQSVPLSLRIAIEVTHQAHSEAPTVQCEAHAYLLRHASRHSRSREKSLVVPHRQLSRCGGLP